MECYKCGAHLGVEDTCPNCGANVGIYKKIIATSNYFYNMGLERAGVRDLTGAIDALKNSLQYNKVNIRARNLLGLVYYEMGETVAALSEWVISKNYMDKDNIADRYLNDVQSNPTLLNTINQTIKKYNQALLYCQQDSKDLAIIQLKKIISSNPKLVKAHQLLALLYIDSGKYDLAKKSLRTAEQIDRNNTTTMRYLAEIDLRIGEKNKNSKDKKKKKKETTVEYHNGNETIIQPTNLRDNSGWTMILNILVGLILGVTVTYFLLVPNIQRNVVKNSAEAVNEANDTISAKNQEIEDLRGQLTKLTKQVEDAENASADSQAKIDSYGKLLSGCKSYLGNDMEGAADALAEVDEEQLDYTAKQLYDSVKAEVDAKYLQTVYDEAYSEYMNLHFEVAAQMLQKVVDIDDTYHNGDAIYYLAQSYRTLKEYDKAAVLYQKVIDEYPSSYKAKNAQDYMNKIQPYLTQTAEPTQE